MIRAWFLAGAVAVATAAVFGVGATAQNGGASLGARLKANCERSGPGMSGSHDCQCFADKAVEYHDRLVAERKTSPQAIAAYEQRVAGTQRYCEQPSTTKAQCEQAKASTAQRYDPANIVTVQDGLVTMRIDGDGVCKTSPETVAVKRKAECLAETYLPIKTPAKSQEEFCSCYAQNMALLHSDSSALFSLGSVKVGGMSGARAACD